MKIIQIRILITILLICFTSTIGLGQLVVKTDRTVDQLVKNVLAGDGVEITNITYSNAPGVLGFFNGKNSNIGLDSGIILSTGKAVDAVGPNNVGNKSSSNNLGGDADLQTLSPNHSTFDATWIQFTFKPQSSKIKFRFVFGSEEYPEVVNQDYNDVFGFFITGPGYSGTENIAFIPGTTDPISINTINSIINSNYYVDNSNGLSVQFDAFTKVIEIEATVVPCENYDLKFAIADVKDFIYDSGIFIEAKSLESLNDLSVLATEQKLTISECDSSGFNISRTSPNKSSPIIVNYTFEGTAINGVDYVATPLNTVTIAAGSNSAFIKVKPKIDFISETPESVVLKISSPIVCDSITSFFTITDYKPIDTLQFELSCDDTTTNILIVQYTKLDSMRWFDSAHNFIQMSNSLRINNTDSSMYYITSVEKCTGLTIVDSIQLKYFPITTNNDTTICLGDTLQLFAFSNYPNAKYSWISNNGQFFPNTKVPNPRIFIGDTATVTVEIESQTICSRKTFTIFAPELSVKDTLLSICNSGSVELKASGGTSYTWSPSIGLSDSSIANPLASPTTNTEYNLLIKNGPCEKSYKVKVNVDTIPHARAGADQFICSRQTLRLSGSGSDYNSYEWTPSASVDYPNSPDPLANPTETTQYILKAYNGSCFSYDTMMVYVFDSVGSNFSYNYDSCARTISLFPEANLTNKLFEWDFGDGTLSTQTNPVYQYNAEGNYNIKLTTNAIAPCKTETIVQLKFPFVDKERRRVPTVFSPNGDGLNDIFKIYNEDSPCAIFNMKIYNRWGELVYDSDKVFEWDGSSNGIKAPPGAYIYFITGDGFVDKGTLSLVK